MNETLRFPIDIETGPSSGTRVHSMRGLMDLGRKMGLSYGYVRTCSPRELLWSIQELVNAPSGHR